MATGQASKPKTKAVKSGVEKSKATANKAAHKPTPAKADMPSLEKRVGALEMLHGIPPRGNPGNGQGPIAGAFSVPFIGPLLMSDDCDECKEAAYRKQKLQRKVVMNVFVMGIGVGMILSSFIISSLMRRYD